MLKILLTDANNQNTLAAVRHLGSLGYEVFVVGSSKITLAGLSQYCRKSYHIEKSALFSEKLIKILKREKIDVLIPMGYESVLSCNQKRNHLKKAVKFTIPANEALQIAGNKDRLISYAQSIGINTPRTSIITDVKQLAGIRFKYPLVLKAAIEGISPVYVNNEEELFKQTGLLLQIRRKILVQEYIRGKGVGYFGLYQNGRRILSFMHQRLREYPVTGGASTLAKSINDASLEKTGDKILKSLRWTGVAMVEFKQTKNNDFYLMEINPKFWGSLELGLSCGVDFLSGLIKLTRQEQIKPVIEGYPVNQKFQWPFPNDFLHCLKKPSDFTDFFSDLFDKKVKKDINWKDPVPLLFQVIKVFYRLLRKQ